MPNDTWTGLLVILPKKNGKWQVRSDYDLLMQHQRAYLFSWSSGWNTWQLYIRNLVVMFWIGIVEEDQETLVPLPWISQGPCYCVHSAIVNPLWVVFWTAVIWLRGHDGRATNLFTENGATIVYTTIYLHIYCKYLWERTQRWRHLP